MLSPEIEELFKLSKDPAAFEKARKALVEKELPRIAGGDPEKLKRLQAAQWNLETRLDRIKSPHARYLQIQYLFAIQLEEFRQALDNLVNPLRK